MFKGLFAHKDINSGVNEWRNTQNAVLLDVRTAEEYREYHIDGSMNIPLGSLDSLDSIVQIINDRSTPLFVHCLSGGRSARAAAFLKSKGYTDVHDIGGIRAYKGETV